MSSRIEWERLTRATLATEGTQMALAIAALALGWIRFPVLLLVGFVEMVVIVALTAMFYPQRRLSRRIMDVVKMLALCVFCSVFLLASYAGAQGFAQPGIVDVRGMGILVALLLLRLAFTAARARSSADPRMHWARESLLRGAVLMVSMLLASFACFIPGVPLAGLLAILWPSVAADVGLGSVLLLVQAGIACVMSTMRDDEMASIAQQPYLDEPDGGAVAPARPRKKRKR
jgi:hypothetical protein